MRVVSPTSRAYTFERKRPDMLSIRLNIRYPGMEGLLHGCRWLHPAARGGVVSDTYDGASRKG
jgi:hypothetical protein